MSLLEVHKACLPCLVSALTPASPIYLNPANYKLKADGSVAALDGSAGNAMIRIPKFFVSYGYAGTSHTIKISLTTFSGASAHPAFVPSPYRYIGMYPAVGWTSSYQDGDGTNAWFSTSTGKLGSIQGKKPISNLTRAQLRAAATRTGTGWQMMDFWLWDALKILLFTQFQGLNSQIVCGLGNTQFATPAFANIGVTGKGMSQYATGKSTINGSVLDYSNFLGIEDLFGGISEFVDGFNINNTAMYYCQNPAVYADDTASNYTSYGTSLPSASGWINTLQQNAGLMPASVGAPIILAYTKVGDYYTYAGGWKAPIMGGSSSDGVNAGLFSLDASRASSYISPYVGARLCY